MKWSTTFFRTLFVIAVVGGVALGQTGNMVTNGGFESGEPSLWTAEPGTSAGVALSWATDQVQGGTHSLKIVKPNTGSMARWMSGDNVRYWVNDIPSGVDIKLGAYVKTEGVNTNPASDDEKWQVKFWFYDSSDALIGGGPFALDVDQSAATTDWYADTNGVGTVNLPVKAVKLLISAEAGASATGTAWFDTFIFVGRAGAWAGQNWNGFVDADQGWQYWFAPVGGNDGQTVFGASGVTDEQAHSGTYSLKMSADVGRADGEGLFFTETIPIPLNSTGKKYMLSVWMMTDSIIVDSVFNAESALGFTWTWHTKMFEDGGGWNEFTGADLRFALKDEQTGWTRYTAIMEVPRDDAAAVSIRSRAWHKWTGLSYWDDFGMLPLDETNMVTNGGFESGEPSLWTAEPGTSAGVALSWATDQVQGGTHSLKIVKPNTGSMARWMSGNNVRYWVENIPSGVDIKLGAYVKTEGVNTNPASDDEKWQVKFWFYDSSDALIGGGPFALDVDQSAATTDWYADTNGVGTVNLPVKAVKLLISAEAGASATGTAWFDTFIFVGRAGEWAGQNWNGFVDADQGWQYWFAPVGGNDGQTVFGASGVTDEQAHSGTYSLKMSADVGRADGEGLFFTETIPIPLNSTGKKYMLSVWMMTDSIIVDSVFNAESALGFTWTWHTKMFEDGGGWNEFTGADLRFALKDEQTGWTRYTAIMEVPRDDAAAVSIRSRAWHKWTGLSYWDDFEMLEVLSVITSVDEDDLLVDGTVPLDYALHQNYPNPFNPSTTITYDVPSAGLIGLEIYNVLGQKVRTLLNEVRTAGTWQAVWNGTDDGGNLVPSGIYFYRLSSSDVSITKKMMLLK